jgi:hypothetical protein
MPVDNDGFFQKNQQTAFSKKLPLTVTFAGGGLKTAGFVETLLLRIIS